MPVSSGKVDEVSPPKRPSTPLSPSLIQSDAAAEDDLKTTGERQFRMREKNRNAQRRYRERQKVGAST